MSDHEEDRPGQRKYKAYGAANDMWRDPGPILFMSGPAGTGKSRADLEKLHACALQWPGMRGLILRKTRSSLTQSGLVTFEEKVLPANSPICKGARREARSSYHYPARGGRSSEIVAGGMSTSGGEMQRVMSTEYDMVVMIEATEFDEEDLQKLMTRMRNGVMPFQQILGDCNPGPPTHWIKRWESSGRLKLYESRHQDNPMFWDEAKGDWTPQGLSYVQGTLASMTGVQRDRLYLGKWVQAEGVVYPGFDRRTHLIDPFPIPDTWRRIRAIDFGYSNPFTCQWWAIDHDGRMYLYRELYHTKRTVRVHAEQIKALSAGEKIDYTVADHDAEDRATLREGKIASVPAKKMITRGIQAVTERLKIQGDGKPRLYIMRDCLVERDEELWEQKKPTCLLDEFDSYVWPKGTDGKSLKEVPVDDANHGHDSCRYAVMTLDYQRPPVEPDAPEVAEAKKVAAVIDDTKRRDAHLWNFGWNSI